MGTKVNNFLHSRERVSVRCDRCRMLANARYREINCQIGIVWQLIILSLHGVERLHFYRHAAVRTTRRQLRAFNWISTTWFLFIVHSSMNYLVFDYYHSNASLLHSHVRGEKRAQKTFNVCALCTIKTHKCHSEIDWWWFLLHKREDLSVCRGQTWLMIFD